jgi:hypothetical protein
MNILDPASIGRHDSLYLSPRVDDALYSCAARLRAERSKGHSILIVSVFDAPGFALSPSPLPRDLGASTYTLGFASEPAGASAAASSELRFDPAKGDPARERLTRIFEDLRVKVRARHVYLPLGLGGRMGHRLVLQAGLAGLANEHGHNVFLYEERPEVFVPGSVSVRLGLLGARLPAGAMRGVGDASVLRHVLRSAQPYAARGEARSWRDLPAVFRAALAERRAARAWNPQRAFGPRVQPVLHVADETSAAFAREVLHSLVASASARARLAGQAAVYAKSVGGGAHAERYWLLLPQLPGEAEADGLPGDETA